MAEDRGAVAASGAAVVVLEVSEEDHLEAAGPAEAGEIRERRGVRIHGPQAG